MRTPGPAPRTCPQSWPRPSTRPQARPSLKPRPQDSPRPFPSLPTANRTDRAQLGPQSSGHHHGHAEPRPSGQVPAAGHQPLYHGNRWGRGRRDLLQGAPLSLPSAMGWGPGADSRVGTLADAPSSSSALCEVQGPERARCRMWGTGRGDRGEGRRNAAALSRVGEGEARYTPPRPPPCPAMPSALLSPQLLGLSLATLAVLTYSGAHFTVVGRTSPDRLSLKTLQRCGKRGAGGGGTGFCLGARRGAGTQLAPDVALSNWWGWAIRLGVLRGAQEAPEGREQLSRGCGRTEAPRVSPAAPQTFTWRPQAGPSGRPTHRKRGTGSELIRFQPPVREWGGVWPRR